MTCQGDQKHLLDPKLSDADIFMEWFTAACCGATLLLLVYHLVIFVFL